MAGAIYERLANVNAKVKAIGKNSKNQQQGFNYRGIDSVMNELHGLFANERVLVLTEAVGDPMVEVGATKSGGRLSFTRQKWSFHFTADDGSCCTASAWGEGMDSGDKGMNKSCSIALKYALLNLFLIPTEEMSDPDAESHEFQSRQQVEDQRQRGIELLEQEAILVGERCQAFTEESEFTRLRKELEAKHGRLPDILAKEMKEQFQAFKEQMNGG